MAERNSSNSTLICRNSFFCFPALTSIFFILVVARSTTHHRHLTDHSSSSTTKPSDSNCDRNPQLLKVFMYNLPPEFHFGLLDWNPETPQTIWPDTKTKIPPYPGGLNLQHSIEYWLTLDLLFSDFSGNWGPSRVAKRVHNSSEADVIFVPFFSSVCYNRFSKARPPKRSEDKALQAELVKYLDAQEEWRRSGGVDHVIVAHHPNSLSEARNQLWPAMYILSDLGRYPSDIANLQKDVIAPYRHVIQSYVNDTSSFESRPTLLYFQGAIYRKDGGFIRQELFYLLKDEKDVHFTFGSVQRDGVGNATRGMQSSKFCLNIAGDTPSSNRLFDAIASHCVPVIISDDIELPFEDVLDYSDFCVLVRASDAVKEGFLLSLIRGIGSDEWTRMWRRLREVERHFEFRYPSRDDDAVQMIWKALARKVPPVRFRMNQLRRYDRVGGVRSNEATSFKVPSNFG